MSLKFIILYVWCSDTTLICVPYVPPGRNASYSKAWRDCGTDNELEHRRGGLEGQKARSLTRKNLIIFSSPVVRALSGSLPF